MIGFLLRLLERLLTVTLEDLIYIVGTAVLAAVVLIAAFTAYPHLDSKVRFVQREKFDAFGDGKTADLTFTHEQFDDINDIAETSLGRNAEGDERLFCFKVHDGVVSEFRFVDNISESTQGSVAGSCTDIYSDSDFDGFLHTQPDFHDSPSEEDKDLETPGIDYQCIAYDDVVELSGEVGGLNCWNVTGSRPDFNFALIEVGVTSRPSVYSSVLPS